MSADTKPQPWSDEWINAIVDAIPDFAEHRTEPLSWERAVFRAGAAAAMEEAAVFCQQRPCFGDDVCQPNNMPPSKREHHDNCPWAIREAIRARARALEEGGDGK